MSSRDRLHWDEVYSRQPEDAYPAPDPLLFPFTPPLRLPRSASALDLAGGLGQNALWLAAQGYVVDLVDVSRVALTHAQTEATARGLRGINFYQLDLDETRLEPAAYDLIAVFRFLNRDFLPQIRAALRPAGRVIYQTFNTRLLDLQPERNPDYLLHPGELTGMFGDWHILRTSEPAHISQIVAIKPEK